MARPARPRARTARAMRASLLASAIASMLRWSRFDACSIQGHKPRIAVLDRRARTTCAACTNSVLRYLLPRLEILPRIVRSPVDSCFGTSPSQAPKSRPCLNPVPLPIAATTALEMKSPQILLFRRLDRHEVHGGPLHCLRDRLGIAVVVLVPFEERLHVLGRDQTHIVADRSQLPTDVMGARARLHADQATRNIGETAFELTARYLLLQNDGTPLVEANKVEGVLADVDTDRGDDSSYLLRCAHRMLLELCFTPPSHGPAN